MAVPRSCLLLALLALLSVAQACQFYEWNVARVADPALNQSATAYNAEDVKAALSGFGTWTNRYLDPTRTTFACVDSRGNSDQHLAYATLETPGGDMSELTALIVAYHRVKGTTVTEDSVTRIFNAFMKNVATYKRPFYFHTADDKVQHALQEVENATGVHTVVIPMREPEDRTVRDIWYEALSQADSQGCGHVRLMVSRPADYDLTTPAEAAAPRWAIKAFWKYWWPTPDGSAQRRKVYMPILQGSLAGKAMTIVGNTGPGCTGLEPDLAPFHGGSTMFLYHASAVSTLRANVLVPFIRRYDASVDSEAVLEALTTLQGRQLGATLRLLAPVNTLPIFQANLTSTFV